MRIFFRKYFEISFWISALVLLAIMPPGTDPHYSFCIFKLLGFSHCPGCGLGHSISYLFHGNLRDSIAAHPLGIFAVLVILYRIFQLCKLHIFSTKLNHQLWNSTVEVE